ncbi:MAG: tetratricopeptide repeat protein [Planctomycetaceae bacterium]|nr:tetratricopeptide repeat protein [Planctomycetales bacterium]MCB9926890.1 tetratricopeptide repeat protein [Planctomycetaceae bacterium]
MRCFTYWFSVVIAVAAVAPSISIGQQETSNLLTSAYQKTQTAKTVADYTAVIDLCQQAEGSDLSTGQATYVRQLASWAYNRRGESYVDQAATALESGDKSRAAELDAKALADFEKSVENDETRWKAIHNRGVSYALAGKYEKSIADFSRVVELRSDYPNGWFNRAEIRYELGHFEQAISDYTKTLELNPNDFGAFTSRGHAYFRLRKFNEALEDYTMAIELDEDNAEAYANRGDAFQKLERWNEAAADFRKAVELAPELPRAYASAAWLMATCPDEQFRDAELGLQAAKRAIELGGVDNFELLDTLAAAQANSNRFDEAIASVSKAMELAPAEAHRPIAQRLELYNSRRAYRQPHAQTANLESAERR